MKPGVNAKSKLVTLKQQQHTTSKLKKILLNPVSLAKSRMHPDLKVQRKQTPMIQIEVSLNSETSPVTNESKM